MISSTVKSAPSVLSATEIREVFNVCVEKTRCNIAALDGKTWAFDPSGNYDDWNEGFFEIGNWTSSFFTGMALISWNDTEDDHFIRETERLAPKFREKVFVTHDETMHDLGFLYLLYSVALHKLTGKAEHREVGIRAAEVLANRFVPEGNYIRAWGRMDEPDTDYAGLAIIDCMMNLPLLFWATEETGDLKFRDIAIRHSDTTLKHFIRDDSSVYHSYRFDRTGAPIGGDNYCGSDIDSHWARGTTWAIYGFALSYRYTGDERYLDASIRVATEFVKNLDAEVVPVWDFRLGEGRLPIRDSSAGAVFVCAIQELEDLGHATKEFTDLKTAMLARLCSPAYFDATPDTAGLLKFAEVGDGVGYARSAYTSWGDYYFMEGLARELGQKVIWT